MLVAYFVAYYEWIGFAVLGGWLGATFTLFLKNLYVRLVMSGIVVYMSWPKDIKIGVGTALGLMFIPMLYFTYLNEVINILLMHV